MSNPFTFWSANFQIILAPLILYITLVYTSTLKSSVKDISNFRYSIQKIITLIQCVQIYITNSVCTNL